MAKIYLSPSFQQQNVGVGSYGTEEKRCNEIADVVERELSKNKQFAVVRNTPNMSLQEVIDSSNKSNADIHFSIHTNAGPVEARGCEVYAYAPGTEGDKLAQIISKRLTKISPAKGRGVKYNSLAETRQTKAIAVLTEVGFHSNLEEANWIIENIEKIGIELAKSLYEYYNIQYEEEENTEDNANSTNPDIFNDGKINSVFDIQEYLNKFYGSGLSKDNQYGSKTQNALVKALQNELNKQYKRGLIEDGIFGSKTYNASINVRNGAKGRITYLIQMALFIKGYAINIDGKFGRETQRIVKQYQSENGLTVDGIVGKDSFRKMFA